MSAHAWKRDDREDHDAGHPSGYDCWGYAMGPAEKCAQVHECPTPGCDGDPRYAAPGRRHVAGCTYPLPSDRGTCPTCGGESMLRGRCVLPWCPSFDEKGAEEPRNGPLAGADGLARVVGTTEGKA